ncbi:nephrin-like isoform X2 [Brevipalpus obovatus]|uniref:nephrin-like isoform X2 n=1 Tax=Brevipalpus obovatus TaxID=246614 RepID=UPI003D9F6811
MQREILPKKMRSQFDKNRSHTTTTATVTATLATTSDQVRDQQDQADECRLNSYCTSSSSSSSSSIICENLASHDPQHPIVVVDDHFSNHFISSSSCSSSSSSSSTPSSSQFILLYSSTVHHYQRFFKFCALLLVTNLLTHVCLPDNILPAAMAITTHNSDSSGFGQQYFRVSPADHVEVIEGSTIIIQCSIGNQAGPVQWAKDGFVLGFNRSIPGYPRLSMVGNPNDGVHNLKVENAQLEDDGMYQCQVGPSGTSKSIRADSKLTVLLKPKSIDIIGQVNGRTMNGSEVRVQQGEKVTLQCIVRGGKPAALIRWYRKDVELRLANLPNQSSTPTSATSDSNYGDGQLGSVVKSEISLVLQPEDNGISYTCSAVHTALSKPLRKTVTISVLYPPGPPEIIGYRTGEILRAGDILTMTCKSRGGNPLARLTWFKNNEQVDSSFKTYHDREESINEHTITIDSSHNNAAYKCEATSDYISKPMFASVKMSVQFAPTKVTIKGPKEARAGDNVTLTCRSDPSNPASEINWVVDGRSMFTSNSNKSHPNGGYITSANVTLPITSTDRNMKTFSCFAVNRALGETVLATHTLNILYKPEFINDPMSIIELTEGKSASINITAKGNPSNISYRWSKLDGPRSDMDSLRFIKNGSFLEIANVSRIDSGTYRLEASNTQGTTKTTFKINVNYPAIIIKTSDLVLEDVGRTAYLECRVDANPITKDMIKWYRREPSYHSDYAAATSGLLSGSRSTMIDHHPIDEFDQNRIDSGSSSSTPTMTTIHTIPLDSGRLKQTFEENRSFLIIHNVTQNDSGAYECEAYNGIGSKSIAVANFIVKHKPRIINPPILSKSASDHGSIGRLICRAQGAPNVTFQWMREGSILSTDNPLMGTKYRLESTVKLDLITYQSILYINSVSSSDYGSYDCVARNELGLETRSIEFNRTSKPDTPLALRVVNRTSSWITLKWIPGFDGGLQQSFRIRYQKYDGVVDDDSSTISFPSSSSGVDDFESSSSSSSSSSSMPVTSFTAAAVSHYPYMYTDVYPKNSTQFIVKGLQDDQEYIFSIMAYNELGNSAFTDDLIKAKTLKEAPVSEKERISQVLSAKAADLPRLIIIAVSVLGSSLLLLNVVLVACFVRKRRKKRLEEAEADGSSTAKAATIEMYAPASGSGGSYNNGITETSVSGSDEENKSEAAYSGQMDYAMEISATDGVSGNQANIRTNVHHGLSTYLIEDTLPHLNTFYQPHGYPNYVNPVGPDVTVNTYFMDDPHYVDAIRKNSYNQHFENTVNLVSPQTQLTDKPMSDNIKPNGIPPIPPLRSTDLSTFLPMITEEPMLINNGQLGHLV